MRLNTFVAGHQPLTQRGFDRRESAARAEMGAGAEHDAPPPRPIHRVAKLGDGVGAEDHLLRGDRDVKCTHPDTHRQP